MRAFEVESLLMKLRHIYNELVEVEVNARYVEPSNVLNSIILAKFEIMNAITMLNEVEVR